MRKTMIFIIALIFAALIYEAYTLLNNVDGDTISEALWEIGSNFPIFPIILAYTSGLLSGHFWWPLNEKVRK